MKFVIPEIAWHNRDPVLSIDFQPKCENDGLIRLASGGTDTHVLIWYISATEEGVVNLEVAADLSRHQRAVNIVRWSPNGQLLGSGDDESIIFIWKQKNEEPPVTNVDGEEQYKESWVIYRTLRGHMEDVLDISWSSDSLHLASGSVDNKLIVWDVNKGKYSSIIADHKAFVQGVTWDPKGHIIATASSDRVFRAFHVKTNKVISRSSKAILPFPEEHPLHKVKLRLYHDDTLQSYFRRLHFSPDGMLIAVPAGKTEPEQGKLENMKPINAAYIYTRFALKVPVCVLPCGEPTLVTRWSPRLYALKPVPLESVPAFPLKYRMILAVATKRSVVLYDTQQKIPIALITNIHYTRLTDLSWSPDGRMLVISSTDGFCSVVMFSEDELGEPLPEDYLNTQESMDTQTEEPTKPVVDKPEIVKSLEKKNNSKTTAKCGTPKIDAFLKFKNPTKKSPKNQPVKNIQDRTPVKIDLLEDSAMPSWNENSSSEIIKPKTLEPPPEIIELDDSESMHLVYEDTVQSPKAPRRVNFITLSSPKNSKKK